MASPSSMRRQRCDNSFVLCKTDRCVQQAVRSGRCHEHACLVSGCREPSALEQLCQEHLLRHFRRYIEQVQPSEFGRLLRR
jgi:hypothetical protein